MASKSKFFFVILILSLSTALLIAPVSGQHDANIAAKLPADWSVLQETVIPIITSTPKANGSVAHIVQEGQTAWSIAMQYGIDLDVLYQLNDIGEDDVLFTGDELVIIPGPTATISPSSEPTTSPQPTTPTIENTATGISPSSTIPAATPASNNGFNLLVIAGFGLSGILIALCVVFCARNRRT